MLIEHVFEQLRAIGDGSGLATRGEVELALGDVRRLRGWLDTCEAAIVTRAANLDDRAVIPELIVREVTKVSTRQASNVTARAGVLATVPELRAGLQAGRLSGQHVDAVARASAAIPEPQREALFELGPRLARDAATSTVEQFQRHLRQLTDRLAADEGLGRFERQRRATRLARWIDPATGLCHLRGTFDPETGGRLFTAIDETVEQLFHRPDSRSEASAIVPELAGDNDHLAAHALVHLLTRAGRAGVSSSRPRCELSVLIDLQTLRTGLHEGSICETSQGAQLAPATVRRLACEAAIIPIVMGGPSEPLDHGRGRRLATRAQRRALRAAHRTCAVPGCTVAFDRCAIHHLREWLSGGLTDLADLLPLCSRHHHLVHEGGWTLLMDSKRQVTLLPPLPSARSPSAGRAG